MTIVSNVSTLGTASRRLSTAASCVAMTPPSPSNDLHDDGRAQRQREHRADPPTCPSGAWSILTMRGHSDQVVLERECASRGSRRHAEFAEDVLHVPGDGVLADHERRRDLSVALAGRNQTQYLQLTGRQSVRGGLAGSGERV